MQHNLTSSHNMKVNFSLYHRQQWAPAIFENWHWSKSPFNRSASCGALSKVKATVMFSGTAVNLLRQSCNSPNCGMVKEKPQWSAQQVRHSLVPTRGICWLDVSLSKSITHLREERSAPLRTFLIASTEATAPPVKHDATAAA